MGVTPSLSWASAIRRVPTRSAGATPGSEVVRERVAAAAARAGRDGPPTVSIVLTNGHEMTSLRGIQAALGEEAHLVGGSASYANPPGLAVSPGGGRPDETGTSGAVMLLCWPTATVASAFVSGAGDPPAGHRPERPIASAPAAEGVITDLAMNERAASSSRPSTVGRERSLVILAPRGERSAASAWVERPDGQDPLAGAPAGWGAR